MNVRNIRKMKQNLQILPSQNDLQESQLSEIAHYLNNDSSLRTLECFISLILNC